MKKICILTSVHLAFDIRIFHKEAKTLIGAGYDVTLIAQHGKNEIIDGIKIISLPKPKNRIDRIFFLTRKIYKLALKQGADAYHFHDPELIPWMIELKKKTKVKIIYDIHEDYAKGVFYKEWIPKIFQKFISLLFDCYEKSVSRNFDFIIAATLSIGKAFQGREWVVIIRNFPIINNFLSQRLFFEDELGAKNFSIIYIGGISKVYGIAQIVKALEYFDSDSTVRVKLIGKFSSYSYQKEIMGLNGFKKIDYLGWVASKMIPSYLSKANVGIACVPPSPNSSESEPNKLFEYMAAGLPVIASDFPLWKEIIEGNNCGICVNPLKPEKIAEAIKHLMNNPKKAKKMGENGRKAILEKYNWEGEGKKLIELYKELFRD
jgi:glycosyltransferase involved in cell wall biosynthesis